MNTLNSDVLLVIVKLAPRTSLLSLVKLNKTFRRIIESGQHLEFRLKTEFPQFVGFDPDSNFKTQIELKDVYIKLVKFENNRVKVIEIPETIIGPDDHHISDGDLSLEVITKIRTYLEDECISVQRGDIIHLEHEGDYRNHGNYMYDGEKIVSLDYDSYNGYGVQPKEFGIPDLDLLFSREHWSDQLAYNVIRLNMKDYLDQIIDNLEMFDVPLIEHQFGSQTFDSFAKSLLIHPLGVKFEICFSDVDNTSLAYMNERLKDSDGVFESLQDFDEDFETIYQEMETLYGASMSVFPDIRSKFTICLTFMG